MPLDLDLQRWRPIRLIPRHFRRARVWHEKTTRRNPFPVFPIRSTWPLTSARHIERSGLLSSAPSWWYFSLAFIWTHTRTKYSSGLIIKKKVLLWLFPLEPRRKKKLKSAAALVVVCEDWTARLDQGGRDLRLWETHTDGASLRNYFSL